MINEIKSQANEILDDAKDNIEGNVNEADSKLAAAQEGIVAMEGLIQKLRERRKMVSDQIREARQSLALAEGYGSIAASRLSQVLAGTQQEEARYLPAGMQEVTADLAANFQALDALEKLDDFSGRLSDLGDPLSETVGDLEEARELVDGRLEDIAGTISGIRDAIDSL